MLKKNKLALALALTATLMSGSAMALDLLGSVTDAVSDTVSGVTETVSSVVSSATDSGGGGLIGDGDSGAAITISSGSAGESGAVNLGLGGGGGNVVDANIGGSHTLGVNVNTRDGIEVGTRGLVDSKVNLGGSGGLLTVGVGVGGPRGNGNNGNNGTNGTNGNRGNNGGGGIFQSNGSNGNNGGFVASAACAGTNPNQLISLFESTRIRNWNRATNIQLIPVPVCAEVRRQLAGWLAGNQDYHRLVGAVSSDSLINAALSRTKYQPGHVLGVQSTGSTLTVYVF